MALFQDSDQKNIIELRGVSHTYDGGQSYVLQHLNFLVEDKPAQGQFVVILGPSGCGKSTVLRYIAGLQTPSEGSVLIHDEPISPTKHVGMVFQQYSSLPWLTVLDNVSLALKYQGVSEKERRERAMEMITRGGVPSRAH